jgi:antitoxin (DNA-binding transcriptional repressor) of toxin-antitoxin stability system
LRFTPKPGVDFSASGFDNATMSTITLDEMKRADLNWLQRVVAGETLLVLQAGQPVAEIKPVATPAAKLELRPYGLAEGEFIVPDDFDDPLPEEILAAFEGR